MEKYPEYTIGNPMIPGATICYGGVNFAIDTTGMPLENGELYLVLYKKNTTDEVTRILFSRDCYYGNVAAIKLAIMPGEYDYGYISGSRYIEDKCAMIVNGMENFGKPHRDIITYGIFVPKYYGDSIKNKERNKSHIYIPLDETVIYKLHVRGFTMDKSSGVNCPGTFAGVTEKIDYLENLGVNTIQLMPAYEFNDLINVGFAINDKEDDGIKVNYWGYAGAYYYAPKKAYSSDENASEEFRNMVDALHNRNMEVIMEFYFVPGTSKRYIIDCLRFWTFEYGIDGFSVNGNAVTCKMIEEDPVLASVKIFIDNDKGINNTLEHRRIALYNGSILVNIRKFLKGDICCNNEISWNIRENSVKKPVINYLSNHGTFTMMDAVSYNMKHNEANGESNMDGISFNYSYNYGYEGDTDREDVVAIRMKQIKNAFTILMMSQGIPLIYSGDEMGHSCKGNNNPYCQDNEINYINYENLSKNKEIYDFVKYVIEFRKKHKILHMPKELQLSDYMSLGGPDISFHGDEPWNMECDGDNCSFAALFYGKYGESPENDNRDNIYVAFNMNKDEKIFNVPKLTDDSLWEVIFSTDDNVRTEDMYREEEYILTTPPRSVTVMIERVK